MANSWRNRRRRLMRAIERLVTGQSWFQNLIGRLVVAYYRFVYVSARITYITPDVPGRFEAARPFVMGIWHGESLMVPFAAPVRWPVHAMTSRSKDGGVVAAVLHGVGITPIRASGRGQGSSDKVSRRGGVAGLIQARDALAAGGIVTMTADVPKGVPYQAGKGIVTLARLTGAPIIPCVSVCSRHIRLKSWDRLVVALPFGRIAIAMGEAIHVAADADEAAQETARRAVEVELDRLHAVCYAAVGRPDAAQGSHHVAVSAEAGHHG